MKNIKFNLKVQLLLIVIFMVSIIAVSFCFILPKQLLPIYEKNIYASLREPLDFIDSDINDNSFTSEIAYLYITTGNRVLISDNLENIMVDYDIIEIIDKLTKQDGSFIFKGKKYYYSVSNSKNGMKVALTNDNYITSMKKSIYSTIFYTVGITYILVTLVLLFWSNKIVKKIEKLKLKALNIDNDNFNHEEKFLINDELHSLNETIENMRIYIKKQEEYRSQMYQNISHDFKTPITVMKSYIEASEDGIETTSKTLLVLKEQLSKLEIKVHSLLYLNKLNYMKDKTDSLSERCNVLDVINNSVDKFKIVRPEISFIVLSDTEKMIFRGNDSMWEAIIDNILENFIRYADKEIKITVKNKKIILYNDGENIDESILLNIFTPYERGINGVFGLGLSIVLKTLQILNYMITVKNEIKGVKFIIKD